MPRERPFSATKRNGIEVDPMEMLPLWRGDYLQHRYKPASAPWPLAMMWDQLCARCCAITRRVLGLFNRHGTSMKGEPTAKALTGRARTRKEKLRVATKDDAIALPEGYQTTIAYIFRLPRKYAPGTLTIGDAGTGRRTVASRVPHRGSTFLQDACRVPGGAAELMEISICSRAQPPTRRSAASAESCNTTQGTGTSISAREAWHTGCSTTSLRYPLTI